MRVAGKSPSMSGAIFFTIDKISQAVDSPSFNDWRSSSDVSLSLSFHPACLPKVGQVPSPRTFS